MQIFLFDFNYHIPNCLYAYYSDHEYIQAYRYDICEEPSMIASPNTVIDPRAVMIEAVHTPIADVAVS